ncbi:MAG TPA: hypothetical protein VFF49_02290 [Thermodesulfobacteriota bacterium]|nr:hypothetical protein [Thermodesulfobacteriota bacterium]
MKVEEVVAAFKALSREDQKKVMKGIWPSFCQHIMDDASTKEMMVRMCSDMMEGGAVPVFMEAMFKEKMGKHIK